MTLAKFRGGPKRFNNTVAPITCDCPGDMVKLSLVDNNNILHTVVYELGPDAKNCFFSHSKREGKYMGGPDDGMSWFNKPY